MSVIAPSGRIPTRSVRCSWIVLTSATRPYMETMVATAGKKLRRVKKATPPDVYRMRSSRMPFSTRQRMSRHPSGAPDFDPAKGFAANGYGEHSPGQYSLLSAFVTEVVLTMMFLFIIMGATHGKAPAGFAPIAIGLALTLIHLISIPVTNTSVNPARSTGPALFVGGWALGQLWIFWIMPLVGALAAGWLWKNTVEAGAKPGIDEARWRAAS